MSLRLSLFSVVVLCASVAWGQPGQPAKPPALLDYSITGSVDSNSPAENPTVAMEHIEVQRLLLAIADSPRDQAYVEKSLAGSGVTLDDMVANGALRLQDGRYWLNFSLLTKADQETIRQMSNKYSRSLADAVLEDRSSLGKLLVAYDLKGVDQKTLAFVVVGCFALDWDGLELTTEKGYRAKVPKRKAGEFFFMAEEKGGLTLKQIYWGSNNLGISKTVFTTFGDHFSKRVGLGYARRNGPASIRELTEDDFARKVVAVMVALREGPQSLETLAKAAGLTPAQTSNLLSSMQMVGWVVISGEEARAVVPVLTERDRPIVSGARKLVRKRMEDWLSKNYEPVKTSMQPLTPVRQGVPYPQVFDQVWHYLFGIANQKLVESGFFVDPYAPGTERPGYVPVFWAEGLGEAP